MKKLEGPNVNDENAIWIWKNGKKRKSGLRENLKREYEGYNSRHLDTTVVVP
ncbi:MAG: hypothetical protein QW115_01615 [Thermoplasmata archaeon]